MKRINICIFSVVLSYLCFNNGLAQYRYDPRLQWQTIQTTHCVIHYHQGEDSLAQVVARKVEFFIQILIDEFNYQPDKIQIVLENSNDTIIDATTPLPNLTVFLNPTPMNFQLGHYQDWLDLIIAHELTHAIDIDRTGGIAQLFRAVIGRLYFPGLLGPQWLTEGIAVYFETQLTQSGRSLDPFHDMILRLAFLSGQVNTLDQSSYFFTSWPMSNSAYLYGQSIYNCMAERFGRDAIINFRKHYVSSLFPYRISDAMYSATGQKLGQVYDQWFESMIRRYESQSKILQEIGLTASRQLTHIGYENWSPEWSPDGNIIFFVSNDPDQHQHLRTIDLRDGQQSKLKNVNIFETQISCTQSREHGGIFYSCFELNRNYTLSNDIYFYNYQTQKSNPVTKGERARDPSAHPSGTKIVYISSSLGQANLWEYDLNSHRSSLLLSSGPDRLFFNPAWSPDGQRIALSVWEKGGLHDIWIYDVQQKSLRPLLQDPAYDLMPCWSHDGRHIIFSSDRNGVYNLYAYDLDSHQLAQITNVLGGAFDPAISPDDRQIAYVGYSANGFDIHVMDWDQAQPVQTHKVILGLNFPRLPDFNYGYREPEKPGPLPVFGKYTISEIEISPPAPYRSFRTLVPRFILPLPIADERGTGIGVFTVGQDVLSKHSLSLGAQYGVVSHRIGYSVNYENHSFYPGLRFTITDLAVPRSKEVLSKQLESILYWDRRKELKADIIIPFQKLDRLHQIAIGIRQVSYASAVDLAPGSFNPYFEGCLRNFHLQYLFSNAHQYPRSINPVEGITFSARAENYSSILHSEQVFTQVLVEFNKYNRIPGLHRHLIQISTRLGRNTLKSEQKIETVYDSKIRGYDAFAWKSELYQGAFEYQFPLTEIERATPWLPIFLTRLHGALFTDGVQFQDYLNDRRRLYSAGLEFRLDLVLGYLLPARLRVGIALPLHPVEKNIWYFQIDSAF